MAMISTSAGILDISRGATGRLLFRRHNGEYVELDQSGVRAFVDAITLFLTHPTSRKTITAHDGTDAITLHNSSSDGCAFRIGEGKFLKLDSNDLRALKGLLLQALVDISRFEQE